MSFITDQQTLEDLNLTGKYKSGSIFSFFNQVKTSGGEQLLESMFGKPLTDVGLINQRSRIFNHFQQRDIAFPLQRKDFELMENYLTETTSKKQLVAYFGNLKKQVLASTIRDDQYERMQAGVRATISILKTCRNFFLQLDAFAVAEPIYGVEIAEAISIFKSKALAWVGDEEGAMTFFKWSKYDHLLKQGLKNELHSLMQAIYHLDVYIAVAKLGRSKGFTYAEALEKDKNLFVAEALAHPSLSHAVGNAISFNQRERLIFLTGANMAGKSTLMKTIGISLYLAHMGFPVAAKSMQFSVKDGLYSSINVPDDIGLGLSHFYAEVLRVKKVAEEVSSGKALLIIFDELFKGTNVKDAYDATLAVTEAFSAYVRCSFVISTHIIEVGAALKDNSRIQFFYLPTVMEAHVPRYTYQLAQGITTDRQGMLIIENEGILELLKG